MLSLFAFNSVLSAKCYSFRNADHIKVCIEEIQMQTEEKLKKFTKKLSDQIAGVLVDYTVPV